MIELNLQNRSYFNECISKQYKGDRKRAESPTIQAFAAAALNLESYDDICRFLAGHLHWLRGKKPRTLVDAVSAARGNVTWCYAEGMSAELQALWEQALELFEIDGNPGPSPEEAFKVSAAIGAKIQAGKDPALIASLAKKALAKKNEVAYVIDESRRQTQ